jgi:hypothetical protein
MARRRRSSDPVLDRALTMTKQKFGPQQSAILRAIQEAGGQRVSSIRQARSGAKYSTDAERHGQRQIGQAFDQIAGAAKQNSGYVDTLLAPPQPGAATGPGAALVAAIGNSRANLPVTVASQKADAVRQSEERGARARSGGAFAEQAANVTFAGQVGKLRDQLLETQQQAGLSTETTYQDLLDKADDDARADAYLDLAGQREARQAAKDARDATEGGKKPRRTREQRLASKTQFEKNVGLYANKSIALSEDENGNIKTWKLSDAKKGVLGNGNKVKPATAVKLFEKRIRDTLRTDLGNVMAYAVAQTVTYGGVGAKTYRDVYRRYDIRLPRIKSQTRSRSRKERGY